MTAAGSVHSMSTRDDAILAHVGRYRITVRRALEVEFFGGKSCDNVVRRLVDAGKLTVREGLPRRQSYYQLTPPEADLRGVPVGRTKPLRSQALAHAVGVLWFCTLGRPPSVQRRRLEANELRAFHPEFPHTSQAAHCLEVIDGKPRVVRVDVASVRTGVSGLVSRLTARVHDALRDQVLGPMTRADQYGFVVLVESTLRQKAIARLLASRGTTPSGIVQVRVAPSPITLASALQEVSP